MALDQEGDEGREEVKRARLPAGPCRRLIAIKRGKCSTVDVESYLL